MNAWPVVLVHGTRTSATQWDRQLPSLRAAGHTSHAIDLPGHGTRRAEPFELDTAIEAIAAAVREAAPQRVHLIGSSLGGMLAIHAAARGIDHLGSLTVCGGAVQPGRASARLYGRMIELTDHLPGISAEGRGPLLTWILGPEGARAYLRGGRADASVVRPTMEALASLDLLDDLRQIRVPVTFLHGRYDQLRMQEIEFSAAAPRGRLEVLPYGNHMVNLNRPHRFNADLLRVLARAERDRGGREEGLGP
ncbi:MAG TPA: alpha/beta hydrolase [Candidatus Brachybacterium merdavium]|uniref:Alpha/beta hydrolase n=1 Tax=Candidatus Brachybacterium merdavium TaxID=2838513 RepID=A0A9D2RQF5_9MICO|nr:alpha/beta hydrolase [Candidatus Brachybacterium merdavium]